MTTKESKERPTDQKRQTVIYLPESLSVRVGRYMLYKYQGRMGMRNDFILEAIDEKLAKEGY
jgi:hypothetical protein